MHDISLMQGIMLAVMAIIVGFDFWLEALYIFRPIIVCTLTGLILGDVQTGLLAGGLTELAFAGLTPVGGTQPPNPVLAGVMTTVIAYTSGVDTKIAIGLALPFSFLMQYVILFYYSSFSVFMGKADQALSKGDYKTFRNINLTTISIIGLSYGVIVFLCTYVAQQPMQTFVQNIPPWLSHGFEIAGGILPAVGFGLLLKVMLKNDLIPYLIIGFLFVSFVPFSNLLPVALVGTALAIMFFSREQSANKHALAAKTHGGEFNDGI